MDTITAKTLSGKLQISIDYVVREEYETLLLKEIFESEYGDSLVFKGGTALRLCYGSPRFSEDLDFNLTKKFDNKGFLNFLKTLKTKYSNISEIETRDKFYTVFALFRVNDPLLSRSFSIKIEISKRDKGLFKASDMSLKVIKSEATPLTTLGNIASLETILREKEDALKNRKAARDVFDYWFINQLLKKEVKVDFTSFNKNKAKAELHKLLPKTYWKVVDLWLEQE